MVQRRTFLILFLAQLFLGLKVFWLDAAEPVPAIVEFNRDIRPILSDNCFKCHGPDKAQRKAGLHFDTEEGAFADRRSGPVIVPSKPEESELYRRITAANEKKRMPPLASGRKLTARQLDLLRRWIEQGAKWQKHWSLIPPQRPPLPAVKNTRWPKNGIDHFILHRLEAEGLKPSAEADKITLLRRVTLDLTGLPPTPAEVDALVADPSPDAYEKVVDRLLRSARYGERMALPWLDAARYADTNGYQSDGERFMWPWRDWVIDAFNQNIPFDRFTIEQIAGDLLPNATLEKKIATGFNRNHRGNAEGGIIPEEYAVEYVVDRVETTATVWLGLTMGCARCHDHKFDPIKQKEFYRVFAYFNNVPENGRAIKFGNSPPMIKAPTKEMLKHLADLEKTLAAAEREFQSLDPQVLAAQTAWEKTFHRVKPVNWFPSDRLTAHFALDSSLDNQQPGQPAPPARAPQFEEGAPAYVPGRLGQAAAFDGKRFIDAGDVGDFGFYDKFSLAAWIYPTDAKGGAILSRTVETPRGQGYNLCLEAGKIQLHLTQRWLDDALRVETENALSAKQWHHVLAVYDGSRLAAGVKMYIDGKPEKTRVLLDELNQTFQSKEPFRIGSGGGPDSRFHGYIDDVRVYSDVLTPDQAEWLGTPDSITEILSLPSERRSAPQAHKLRAYYLEKHAPEAVRQIYRNLVSLRKKKELLLESFPTTMVMEEMPKPRDTYVLLRGVYDKHGEKVTPGVPASLNPWPQAAPNNRLGLARWLMDPANPLTARVTVNRFWQMYFGTGIVKTPEDFGSQGEWPSQPELLDWLATEFIRTGWNVKAMQKLIVLSAAYRQSSKVTPELLHQDPDNRWLARGPRFRLSAQMLRDQALAASGLLVEKLGGPSVRTYQPGELWKELADSKYEQDHGEKLYRRSLYTFWKRTVAPPSMITFDAAAREACCVRPSRTNTPLQALTLMNEVTFVEAARVLAQRILREGGKTPEERLTLGFRLAAARKPKPAELKILVTGLHDYLAEFRHDAKAAEELLRVGEYPVDRRADAAELAAYTMTASMILNLDEVITKE